MAHSSHDALRRRRLPDASDRNEVSLLPIPCATSALPESSQEQHSLQLPRQHLTLSLTLITLVLFKAGDCVAMPLDLGTGKNLY